MTLDKEAEGDKICSWVLFKCTIFSLSCRVVIITWLLRLPLLPQTALRAITWPINSIILLPCLTRVINNKPCRLHIIISTDCPLNTSQIPFRILELRLLHLSTPVLLQPSLPTFPSGSPRMTHVPWLQFLLSLHQACILWRHVVTLFVKSSNCTLPFLEVGYSNLTITLIFHRKQPLSGQVIQTLAFTPKLPQSVCLQELLI